MEYRRDAYVYLAAGMENTYRIRAERYPDDDGTGWFGGKVLWGCDQDSREKADRIAADWIEHGVLPEEFRG